LFGLDRRWDAACFDSSGYDGAALSGGVGSVCAGDTVGATGVLLPISFGGRIVFQVGRGMPAALHESECAKVRDVLGTSVLGSLSGAWRYAHVTALRGDKVNPQGLGMEKVVSEDSLRRISLGSSGQRSILRFRA